METVGKLYMMEVSPTCRAVLLTAKMLGIEFEKISVNLVKCDNLTDEFKKLNVFHTIPTYQDNDGTLIGDSHAIMIYLIEKYGKEDLLYPKQLNTRAIVNQHLFYDCGTVYALTLAIVTPMWYKKENGPSERQLETVLSMYDALNQSLEEKQWIAGTASYTIADFSLINSIRTLHHVVIPENGKYPFTEAWIKRCEKIPYFQEVNDKGEKENQIAMEQFKKNIYTCIDEYRK